LWTAENVIICCRNLRFGNWKLFFWEIAIWSLYSSVWVCVPKWFIGQTLLYKLYYHFLDVVVGVGKRTKRQAIHAPNGGNRFGANGSGLEMEAMREMLLYVLQMAVGDKHFLKMI